MFYRFFTSSRFQSFSSFSSIVESLNYVAGGPYLSFLRLWGKSLSFCWTVPLFLLFFVCFFCISYVDFIITGSLQLSILFSKKFNFSFYVCFLILFRVYCFIFLEYSVYFSTLNRQRIHVKKRAAAKATQQLPKLQPQTS